MPLRTRSNKMVETHSEGGGGTSYERPKENLMSMMARMMSYLKHEMNNQKTKMVVLMKEIENQLYEVDVRMNATQNTLYEKIKALKKSWSTRSPTPRVDPIPNYAPEEYEEWHRVDEHRGNRE
ncbi:hypothetical protein AAHA92_33889 [Salvia divinorum]|uniref:Uncharacterized protein n=1 Tax=Salvia divinorum TaxID=28513 RepID=A0ABD1FH67_SALDI